LNICIDARPLQNAHRTRGVGVLLGKLLPAMGAVAGPHAVSLISQNGPALPEMFIHQNLLATHRLVRPNRFNWIADQLFLPGLVRRSGAGLFFATDFNSYLLPQPGLDVVSMAYDLIPFVFPEAMRQQPLSVRVGWRRNFAKLCSSRAVIAISEATKSDLVQTGGVSPDRIEVVYPGIDHTLFCPANASANGKTAARLNEYGIGGEFLLYVGDSEPRKNLQRVLQAFSRTSRPLELLIVGKRAPADRQLASWIADAGVAGRVRFSGYVAEEELPGLYGAARALIFPTLYEGFGIPVVEAMASGCPVITSTVSSLPEVAGDAALLVDPESIDDIAGAIEALQNKDLGDSLRLKGLERSSQFRWENAAEKTWRVLESVGMRKA
jgi:glycosyltransferase involved in cell wall biosynthesis